MSNQNLDALYGDPGRGDYSIGDQVTFHEGEQTFTGEIIHVTAPGRTVSGRPHPTEYQVDCGDGFPHVVYQSQILER